MKLYTFYTDSHSELMQVFLKNFPYSEKVDVVIRKMPQECKTAAFMSEGWNNTMTKKVEYILHALSETPENEWFVHADSDILLFSGWETILNEFSEEYDMLIQNDYSVLCAGFFFCKNNKRTKELWNRVRETMHHFSQDQEAMNHWVNNITDLKIKILPPSYFTYGLLGRGVWNGVEGFTIPDIDNLKMFHANWTIGLENKKKLLKETLKQRMIYEFRQLRPYPPQYPTYPPYSRIDQYIEHYFFNYYKNNSEQFNKIDREYLPIFWTTIYNDNIPVDVQNYLTNLDPNKKYFTVIQHDNGVRYNLPKDTLVFSASEEGQGTIIPIPLLTSPIPEVGESVEKDILCSFVGTMTHHYRTMLHEKYSNNSNFYFTQWRQWSSSISNEQLEEFKNVTKRSKFSLCPRGNIIQSFRIYEALQLGSIPVIFSNDFTYPFNSFVNWKEFSVIIDVNDLNNLENILHSISDEEYIRMSEKAKEVYRNHFTLEKMCVNILNILNEKSIKST